MLQDCPDYTGSQLEKWRLDFWKIHSWAMQTLPPLLGHLPRLRDVVIERDTLGRPDCISANRQKNFVQMALEALSGTKSVKHLVILDHMSDLVLKRQVSDCFPYVLLVNMRRHWLQTASKEFGQRSNLVLTSNNNHWCSQHQCHWSPLWLSAHISALSVDCVHYEPWLCCMSFQAIIYFLHDRTNIGCGI